MNNVYAVQEAPHLNLTPALQYGELHYLFPPGDVSGIEGNMLIEILKTKLKNFDAGDYLLLTGDPELIAAAFYVATCYSPMVSLLKYDRRYQTYHVRSYVDL